MFKNLTTRTIDNLQVTIKTLHVRLESNNSAFSQDLFSMGFTLENLKLCTTDANWQPTFVDRTNDPTAIHNTLFKLLKIDNLGFYYRPNESQFILNTNDD